MMQRRETNARAALAIDGTRETVPRVAHAENRLDLAENAWIQLVVGHVLQDRQLARIVAEKERPLC